MPPTIPCGIVRHRYALRLRSGQAEACRKTISHEEADEHSKSPRCVITLPVSL